MSDTISSRCWSESALDLQSHGDVATAEPPVQDATAKARPRSLTSDSTLRPMSTRRSQTAGIFIADDHPIFRDGLRRLIESQEGMWVTGESAVGGDVVRLARALKPEIVVLDLGLPRRNGFQVLSELSTLPSPVRTLVMAEEVDQSSILEAFYLGAYGFVLKGSPRDVLLKSICSVIEGQYWLDNSSVPVVIQALRKSPPASSGMQESKDFGLTPQELKIVGRVANGSSNKEVGHEFSISERTVKHHLTNVFNKLGLSSRLELAVFALDHGLVVKR
jgi:two-component system, NarL family, nitrate/nitrite response regulator NarL